MTIGHRQGRRPRPRRRRLLLRTDAEKDDYNNAHQDLDYLAVRDSATRNGKGREGTDDGDGTLDRTHWEGIMRSSCR